jgi:hypothetical protein
MITHEIHTLLLILYLSVAMSFKSVINCDVQRLLKKNVYVNHLVLFCAFLFLISLNNTSLSLSDVWLQSIMVYFLFMLFIKSQLWTVVTVFFLLIVDQSINSFINTKLKEDPSKDVSTLVNVRKYITYIIVGTILVGFYLYFLKQKSDHPKDFSFLTFFFGVADCQDV